MNARDFGFTLGLGISAALLFFWPIPGTIAVRNVLIALLLVMLVWSCKKDAFRFCLCRPLVLPFGIFTVLTCWIALVIAGWGAEPGLSWKEFWAQWTLPALCGLAGCSLAKLAVVRGEVGIQSLLKVLFYTLFLQVLMHDLLDTGYLFSTGVQPFRQAPVLYLPVLLSTVLAGDPWTNAFIGLYVEKFSFVNNTFAAILVAEILQRTVEKQRWLQVPSWLLCFSLMLVILCSYWLRVRNGNLGLVLLLIFAGLVMLIRMRNRLTTRNLAMVLTFAFIGVVGLSTVLWKSDARWQTFIETVPIAFDTETHKAWISNRISPYPLLSNGEMVDASNYERIAWIKEGVKLGWEHPLGTGLNRNAFFDGLDRKYQMNGMIRGGHSHSGVLDFFIANGLPGLLLWFAFLLSLMALGWQVLACGSMALGLMMIFLISGFFSRSLIDSNIRDHALQEFFFLAGIFAFICSIAKYKVRPSSERYVMHQTHDFF